MGQQIRTLIVADHEADAELLLGELRRGGYKVSYQRVETAEAMNAAFDREGWELVLSAFTLQKFSAFAALALVKERRADVPFIVVSGTRGREAALEGIRGGALDCMSEGSLQRLLPTIARELNEMRKRNFERGAIAELLEADDRTRLEEQHRQSQKMEAIGRLAGGVAHDFNNLLSVIIGYANLLVDQLAPDNAIRVDLEEILSAAVRASALTKQLLAFSRQQVLESRVLNLHEVATGVEKMLRRLLVEDVELTLITAPELDNVQADRGQVEQIIMNLAVNACDAMPNGGQLVIETANVELGPEYAALHLDLVPGPYVMLSVSDTGEGMTAATRARVFEPFFTTKAMHKGTGLGLSTVFGIVRQSGGHLFVDSELGQGSVFRVYLPKTNLLPDPTQITLPPPATLQGPETVLVVEDEDQVRGVFRTILQRNGYEVLEARNGDEALTACECHPGTIDLLLTDVKMPRMSGRELAQRLGPTRPNMKVLYASGYTENAILQHGPRSGINFLAKPISPESLLRKVREVLDRPIGLYSDYREKTDVRVR